MRYRSEKQQIKIFLLGVSLLTIIAGIAAVYRGSHIGAIAYTEHLNEVILTIDKKEYLLRDAAVYIAYQEMQVDKQAKVYDLENPNAYWNVRGEDAMVRTKARNAAMDMLIHDCIFYEMAVEKGIELESEEKQYMQNQQKDFWSDLEEEGQARIGVGEKELAWQFEKMALAQKQQQILADEAGVDYEEYTIGGDSYEQLLESYTYKIQEKLWDKLRFGKIVLQ